MNNVPGLRGAGAHLVRLPQFSHIFHLVRRTSVACVCINTSTSPVAAVNHSGSAQTTARHRTYSLLSPEHHALLYPLAPWHFSICAPGQREWLTGVSRPSSSAAEARSALYMETADQRAASKQAICAHQPRQHPERQSRPCSRLLVSRCAAHPGAILEETASPSDLPASSGKNCRRLRSLLAAQPSPNAPPSSKPSKQDTRLLDPEFATERK